MANQTVPVTRRPCISCGAPIYDLRSATTGRPAPIDVDPVERGNIKVDLEAGTYRVVGVDLVNPSPNRYVSHFTTCPDAVKFRTRRMSR